MSPKPSTPAGPSCRAFSARAASCAPLQSRCATQKSGIRTPWSGPAVFLGGPGAADLAEAASELASVASVEAGAGGHQEWRPIIEGELDKARAIQSEATGLNHREIEQAVISVFLSSQPIGQKAQTRELMTLLGTTNPDKIELEKALRRWTELSWFLDEVQRSTRGKPAPTARRNCPERGGWGIAPTCAKCTTTPAAIASLTH